MSALVYAIPVKTSTFPRHHAIPDIEIGSIRFLLLSRKCSSQMKVSAGYDGCAPIEPTSLSNEGIECFRPIILVTAARRLAPNERDVMAFIYNFIGNPPITEHSMSLRNVANGFSRSRAIVAALIVMGVALPTAAQSPGGEQNPVTAKIVLGPQAGSAKPVQHGMAYTGGGNIDVAQPTPDTLVVTMGGSVAASSSMFMGGEAMLSFFHEQRFAVEFSDPAATGKLHMQVKINGLLRGEGKQASVGITNAATSIFCGPNEIASLPVPPRMTGGCNSEAVSASHGPVCVPIYAGCYSLRQQFGIAASQPKGLACHKASAQFSPGSLAPTWIGSTDPFHAADASNLGYQLILRVVPDPATSQATSTNANASLTQLFPAP